MSYKIVNAALMKHINNDSQINVPPSAAIDPCSGYECTTSSLARAAAGSMAPRHRGPALGTRSDPRELALRIPTSAK